MVTNNLVAIVTVVGRILGLKHRKKIINLLRQIKNMVELVLLERTARKYKNVEELLLEVRKNIVDAYEKNLPEGYNLINKLVNYYDIHSVRAYNTKYAPRHIFIYTLDKVADELIAWHEHVAPIRLFKDLNMYAANSMDSNLKIFQKDEYSLKRLSEVIIPNKYDKLIDDFVSHVSVYAGGYKKIKPIIKKAFIQMEDYNNADSLRISSLKSYPKKQKFKNHIIDLEYLNEIDLDYDLKALMRQKGPDICFSVVLELMLKFCFKVYLIESIIYNIKNPENEFSAVC